MGADRQSIKGIYKQTHSYMNINHITIICVNYVFKTCVSKTVLLSLQLPQQFHFKHKYLIDLL